MIKWLIKLQDDAAIPCQMRLSRHRASSDPLSERWFFTKFFFQTDINILLNYLHINNPHTRYNNMSQSRLQSLVSSWYLEKVGGWTWRNPFYMLLKIFFSKNISFVHKLCTEYTISSFPFRALCCLFFLALCAYFNLFAWLCVQTLL